MLGDITEGKVEGFLKLEIQIQVNVTDAFWIGRTPGKQIIVTKIKDRNQKTKIMDSKNKLQGMKVYIWFKLATKNYSIWYKAENQVKLSKTFKKIKKEQLERPAPESSARTKTTTTQRNIATEQLKRK